MTDRPEELTNEQVHELTKKVVSDWPETLRLLARGPDDEQRQVERDA